MITLVISEIDNSIGPGDIVGAFINEAGTASDDIGRIKIDKEQKKAEVEVNWQTAPKIIEIMDKNQIGGVKVRVNAKNPDDLIDKDIMDYYNKYYELINLERKAEIDRHKLEIKYLSGRQRQAKGRTLLDLKAEANGTTFGHRPLVKFFAKSKGEKIPESQITTGDLIMVSMNGGAEALDSKNLRAVVTEKTAYSITAAFDSCPPKPIYDELLRLDLLVNDSIFQRMFSALADIKKPKNEIQSRKRDILLERTKPNLNEAAELELPNLNSSQNEAAAKAAAAEDIYLVQGLPGTGKTVTAVELITKAAAEGKKVLAAADSNTAVDNLLSLLVEKNLNVIRIGHPIQSSQNLSSCTLAEIVLEHSDYLAAEKLRTEVSELINKQESYIYPKGSYRRGLSDQEIKNYAKKDLEKHIRGISPSSIAEMAAWLELQEKIDKYFKEIERLEAKAVAEILAEADVICATNINSASEFLKDIEFELSVIDEAAQAAQPAALIPYLKAEKTVLFADQKQLAPTIVNQELLKNDLKKSLFEKLMAAYEPDFSSLLKTQYRMNRKIMGFSSIYFYNNQLKAAAAAAERRLSDLGVRAENNDCFTEKVLKSEYPLVFLDTREMRAGERFFKGSNSYDNPVEAEIVLDIIDRAVKLSLSESEIAVIAPYKDQVDLINQRNNYKNVEIDTVEAFQGREKEMIIFTAVRSNKDHNIGLLRDLRRLNVVLTRAKRKLIIVADSTTICSRDVYQKLLKYIKKSGLYYQL